MYGSRLLKEQGWKEGEGLGKDKQGIQQHVRATRKDDAKGIGYNESTDGKGWSEKGWSQQNNDFCDVLSRLKKKGYSSPTSASPGGDSGSNPESPTRSAPSAGRFGATYEKRRKLKTGYLHDELSQSEVMGQGRLDKRERCEDGSDDEVPAEDDEEEDNCATSAKELKKFGLVSPTLLRLMVKGKGMKASQHEANVVVSKPEPKPPVATETPFNA